MKGVTFTQINIFNNIIYNERLKCFSELLWSDNDAILLKFALYNENCTSNPLGYHKQLDNPGYILAIDPMNNIPL